MGYSLLGHKDSDMTEQRARTPKKLLAVLSNARHSLPYFSNLIASLFSPPFQRGCVLLHALPHGVSRGKVYCRVCGISSLPSPHRFRLETRCPGGPPAGWGSPSVTVGLRADLWRIRAPKQEVLLPRLKSGGLQGNVAMGGGHIIVLALLLI